MPMTEPACPGSRAKAPLPAGTAHSMFVRRGQGMSVWHGLRH